MAINRSTEGIKIVFSHLYRSSIWLLFVPCSWSYLIESKWVQIKLDDKKLQPVGKQQSCALGSLEADRPKVAHICQKRDGVSYLLCDIQGHSEDLLKEMWHLVKSQQRRLGKTVSVMQCFTSWIRNSFQRSPQYLLTGMEGTCVIWAAQMYSMVCICTKNVQMYLL